MVQVNVIIGWGVLPDLHGRACGSIFIVTRQHEQCMSSTTIIFLFSHYILCLSLLVSMYSYLVLSALVQDKVPCKVHVKAQSSSERTKFLQKYIEVLSEELCT